MSTFKTSIEKILSKRKENIPYIEEDEKKIKNLRDKLDEIIKECNKNESFSELTKEIDDTQKKLKEVSKKITNTKLRFARDTLNIGVSGQARVGKSTLLQTLTGLNDNQLPTGHGNPVTAVCSCIHNVTSESYADIEFYTEDEFIQKRIKPLSKYLNNDVSSISDFKSINFDDFDLNFESNDLSSRLKEMKESINDFEDLLGAPRKKLTNLDEVVNYVAYRNDLNMDSYKMYYPAVKKIDIYCPFPNLDGDKIQFVDLPGFGENGDVDKIQLSGLENNVDHFMLITMPTNGAIAGGKNYATITDDLATIQKAVKNRSELESFVINVNNTDINNVESLIVSWRETLNKDPNVSNKNKYEVDVKNDKKSVNEMFENILSRMTDALPKMDRQFLDFYKKDLQKDLQLEGLIKKIEVLQKKVDEWIKNTPADMVIINDEKKALRNSLSNQLQKIKDALDAKDNDATAFGTNVASICKKIKENIDANMMFSDSIPWEEHVNSYNGITDKYHEECHRLRINILAEYEKLNEYYNTSLETVKNEIISVISGNTKGLVKTGSIGSGAIKDVLSILDSCDENIPKIREAFAWLSQLHLDFRSQVYPSIFNADEMNSLDPDKTALCTTNSLELMKEQLSENAKSYAQAIKQSILDHDSCNYFLRCSIEHFSDLLTRSNDNELDNEFLLIVSHFGKNEKNNNKKMYQTLRDKLEECVFIIEDLEEK